MRFDQGITNFKVFEGATDFYGVAEVQLPELSLQGDDMKGAGIAGTFAAKFTGHTDAMTLSLSFRSIQKHLISLVTPEKHLITLMASQQHRDNDSGKLVDQPIKHVLGGIPIKYAPGKLAPAAFADSNVDFSITYFATYLDGIKVMEVDQINFIYFLAGVDYLTDVRKNIGMY